jgi:predicted nucleotidyltransferase
MRLSHQQVSLIRQSVAEVAGENAHVWLFGSRVRDDARGGDVDLLLELDHCVAEPAALAASLATRVSRGMYGRKVDVVLSAPNLAKLPIHRVAMAEGIQL